MVESKSTTDTSKIIVREDLLANVVPLTCENYKHVVKRADRSLLTFSQISVDPLAAERAVRHHIAVDAHALVRREYVESSFDDDWIPRCVQRFRAEQLVAELVGDDAFASSDVAVHFGDALNGILCSRELVKGNGKSKLFQVVVG